MLVKLVQLSAIFVFTFGLSGGALAAKKDCKKEPCYCTHGQQVGKSGEDFDSVCYQQVGPTPSKKDKKIKSYRGYMDYHSPEKLCIAACSDAVIDPPSK